MRKQPQGPAIGVKPEPSPPPPPRRLRLITRIIPDYAVLIPGTPVRVELVGRVSYEEIDGSFPARRAAGHGDCVVPDFSANHFKFAVRGSHPEVTPDGS